MQILYLLTHEQLILYNAPPPNAPTLPPLLAPPPSSAAAATGDSAAAASEHAGGGETAATRSASAGSAASSVERRVPASPQPVARQVSDEDSDGQVPCAVSADGPGWRRVCDMCSASIMNVYLRADGKGSADGSEAYELCVDCWGAAMRGAADWPAALESGGERLSALSFTAHAELHPSLTAEASRRVQAALSTEQLQHAGRLVCICSSSRIACVLRICECVRCTIVHV